MTKNEIIEFAEMYLNNRGLKNYVKPGRLGKSEDNKIEVMFLKPEALDPAVVIDPPDIRVFVNTTTKEVTWIYQI